MSKWDYDRYEILADHARDLVNGSFELFSTRTAESTDELVLRLTFMTMLLGAVGAIAGIFSMNFETPYLQSGVLGFWSVIGVLVTITVGAILVARLKDWI
jgi:Mg2+ and Co2+ transporter CorA